MTRDGLIAIAKEIADLCQREGLNYSEAHCVFKVAETILEIEPVFERKTVGVTACGTVFPVSTNGPVSSL